MLILLAVHTVEPERPDIREITSKVNVLYLETNIDGIHSIRSIRVVLCEGAVADKPRHRENSDGYRRRCVQKSTTEEPEMAFACIVHSPGVAGGRRFS